MNLLKKYISVTYKNKHRIIKFFGIKIKTKFDCYDLSGANNKIILVSEDGHEKILKPNEKIPGLNIWGTGSNSCIKIHQPNKFLNTNIVLRCDNTYLEIKKSMYCIDFDCEFVLTAPNSKIQVGENFSCGRDSKFIITTSPANITIGDDCMFSSNVQIRTGDGHTIKNLNTGEILNFSKDICIGNHCWIGHDVTVLKGVRISDGCIIGTKSLVTKSITKRNSISGGVPSKIIKMGVMWERAPICLLKEINKNTKGK